MTLSANKHPLYFFIGTEAEFIKLFPILLELNKKKISYSIIASGQNDITKSFLLKIIDRKSVDYLLSQEKIAQTAFGLFSWFFKTLCKGAVLLKKNLPQSKGSILVVHGDTVSTVMGALLGKFLGMKIVHVEAGLRSFNFLQPFPEEIDRVIVSRFASVHFCPNSWAVNNIKKLAGKKINTYQNTLYDSLHIIMKQPLQKNVTQKKPYFIFIMHRQENIFDKDLSKAFLEAIFTAAEKTSCVFVMHSVTKKTLETYGFLQSILRNKNIHVIDRLPYGSFIHLLNGAEFIITDGGSNQEECSYLGVPTLVLRSVTERIEGLGKNVILQRDATAIPRFVSEYKRFKQKPVTVKESPSKIIADVLGTY